MINVRIDILTLFPEVITNYLNHSIMKRAIENGHLTVNVINFRDYAQNKHQSVDDTPYGGGAGMLISIEPIYHALEAIDKSAKTKVILTTPTGTPFNQRVAERLKDEEHLVLICGHYEGIDYRVNQFLVDEEISIGDYVLTGGELPALVILDSVARLLPNVLGRAESHQEDSFSTRLLEYPQYTRPADFKGMKVPEVLQSGNHKLIEIYRKKEALRMTYLKRPDLLADYPLSEQEKKLLAEVISEESEKITD